MAGTRQKRLDAFSDIVGGDETNVERMVNVGPNSDKMRMRINDEDVFKLYMILCKESEPYVAAALADVMSAKNGKGINAMRKVLRKYAKKDVSSLDLAGFHKLWIGFIAEAIAAMAATRIPGEEDF